MPRRTHERFGFEKLDVDDDGAIQRRDGNRGLDMGEYAGIALACLGR